MYGNTAYKNGNFTAAVKAYTKCLGLKARNYIAFSNRALSYLKLKEYSRAIVSIAWDFIDVWMDKYIYIYIRLNEYSCVALHYCKLLSS